MARDLFFSFLFLSLYNFFNIPGDPLYKHNYLVDIIPYAPEWFENIGISKAFKKSQISAIFM